MYPVICSIGPLKIYSYGLMVGIAFIVATYFALKRASLFGIPKEVVNNLVIIFLISGILGARILYVALNINFFIANPSNIFMINRGGLVFYGGFIGALIAGIIYARAVKVSILDAADLIVPFAALGHAIGRIGCFLNGCCYGKLTDSFIGVVFPNTFVKVYPSQLFSSAGLLIIFAILFRMQKHRRFKGQVLALYLISYGAFRFLIEFTRGDMLPVFYDITVTQIISLVIMLCGINLYLWKRLS